MGGPHYPMHHGVVPAGPDVIQHPGWLTPKPTAATYPTQMSVTSESLSARKTATPRQPVSSAGQSSLASPSRVASNVGTSETSGRVRNGSLHWQGGSWEDFGGAPNLMSREVDYGRREEEACRDATEERARARSEKSSKRAPVPHRKRADILPEPPSLEPDSSPTEATQLSQSPNLKARTGSSRGAGPHAGRPRSGKRQQDKLVPPSLAHGRTIMAESSVTGESVPPSPYRKLALSSPQQPRPRPVLKGTPLTTIFSATSSGSESTISTSPPGPRSATGQPRHYRPERRHSDKGSPGRLSLPDPARTKRYRHASSPNLNLAPSVTSAGSQITPKSPRYAATLAARADSAASSSAGQTIDFMSSAAPLDMNPLAFALPAESIVDPVSKVRAREDSGPGYISPLDDDPYDRYTAHPAAPTPPRADQHVNTLPRSPGSHQVSPTVSLLRVPTPPSGGAASVASETRSLARGAVISETARSMGAPKVYTPLGHPLPKRHLPWNREGPAMRTHGVAWVRQDQVGENGLSVAPAGPRWDVARPPRGEMVTGGTGWWESGGNA